MATGSNMSMAEERFTGTSGMGLFVRTWHPAGTARGIVVIVPGFNSHGGYYLWVGEQFAASGLIVYAVDLRGRGRSDGERFYIESFADYMDDVADVFDLLRSREPALPTFLLGHSAGGVVSCLYASEHQSELAGFICESFAFQVPAPDFAIAALKGLSHLAPHAHVLRLANADFSRNPAVVEAMNEDPLIAHETQPTRTVAELARADERLAKAFPSMTLPLLILHGTADKATRFEGSRRFFDEAASTDKTLKLYDGHYHDLLNDVGREHVMADVTAWITAHLA
jgi:alpha-beta hydrolase superfamily lysophospholipase